VEASLREASTQSKDIYSSRASVRVLPSNPPAPHRTSISRLRSFDSVRRFASRIGYPRSG